MLFLDDILGTLCLPSGMAFEKRSPTTGCPVAQASNRPPASSDVLDGFVKRGIDTWARQPLPLPARLTAGLRWLGAADAAVAAWMYLVHHGLVGCTNTVCSITTLGGREVMLGLIAAGSLLALLALAVPTGGFRRADLPAAATVCVAGVATLGAALGLVLAALVVVTAVVVGASLVLVFVLALGTPQRGR